VLATISAQKVDNKGFSRQIAVITPAGAHAPVDWGCPGPGLEVWHGGVMRIGRAIIIPAIVALGLAGSALVGSAMPAVAANVPAAHVSTTGISTGPNMYHHN
jgi:hypothetical protein